MNNKLNFLEGSYLESLQCFQKAKLKITFTILEIKFIDSFFFFSFNYFCLAAISHESLQIPGTLYTISCTKWDGLSKSPLIRIFTFTALIKKQSLVYENINVGNTAEKKGNVSCNCLP